MHASLQASCTHMPTNPSKACKALFKVWLSLSQTVPQMSRSDDLKRGGRPDLDMALLLHLGARGREAVGEDAARALGVDARVQPRVGRRLPPAFALALVRRCQVRAMYRLHVLHLLSPQPPFGYMIALVRPDFFHESSSKQERACIASGGFCVVGCPTINQSRAFTGASTLRLLVVEPCQSLTSTHHMEPTSKFTRTYVPGSILVLQQVELGASRNFNRENCLNSVKSVCCTKEILCGFGGMCHLGQGRRGQPAWRCRWCSTGLPAPPRWPLARCTAPAPAPPCPLLNQNLLFSAPCTLQTS